jgi:DNA primase
VTSKNPKYINSPESEWFKKKAVLYGLERAQKFIRDENYVCVVEGFFDQWAFDRNEIPSVAVMGTALTLDHLSVLGRYTKNVVLVMDTDNAGIQSTRKSVVLLLEHGWTVRVFSSFEGKDPDEWLKKLSREKNLKEKVRSQLLSASEGLEWLAENTLAQGQSKNLSRGELIQELGSVWAMAKQETQKLRILDLLSPVTGFNPADLRRALDEVRVVGPSKKDDEMPSPLQKVNAVSTIVKIPATLIDRLAEQCFLWWIWHRDYLWPQNEQDWSSYRKLFSGTYLEPVVELMFENREFWGQEAPEKVVEQYMANPAIEPLLNATLLKSMVRSDKGQTSDSGKASNSFREMSDLLNSEKTKNRISFLKNEIRKNSHDSEKTAQLLHAVQELIQSKN